LSTESGEESTVEEALLLTTVEGWYSATPWLVLAPAGAGAAAALVAAGVAVAAAAVVTGGVALAGAAVLAEATEVTVFVLELELEPPHPLMPTASSDAAAIAAARLDRVQVIGAPPNHLGFTPLNISQARRRAAARR
jgi:hypothetical protein